VKHWILDGHDIVETDLMTWAMWFETADRRVANDHVGDKRVSTVFLGIDHNFGDEGPPLLFETMVFGEGSFSEQACDRYSTWEEAVEGHARMVDSLKQPA